LTTTPPDVAEKLYYRIGEVEEITAVPAYVLRYWESEFKLLRPKKNPAGQRLYRPRDVELVQRIKTLLYDERLTLEGAKKRLLAESRKANGQQLDLGLREATYADTLRRVRDRLTTLRERLAGTSISRP
jgi:DNA-binding transcriptional MerR regulator